MVTVFPNSGQKTSNAPVNIGEKKFIFFVEGDFDEIVLTELLKTQNIDIKKMGAAPNLKSVATSFSKAMPNYFFAIDRDHQSKNEVETTWKNFPDAEKSNLIIWRRKEIENYFFDPEIFCKSNFLNKSESEIKTKILTIASSRLYYEAARITLSAIRTNYELVTRDLNKFSDKLDQFKTKEESLDQLVKFSQLNKIFENQANYSKDKIAEIYKQNLDELTGGRSKLEFNQGKWQELMSGKAIFSSLFAEAIDQKQCPYDNDGKRKFIHDLFSKDTQIPNDLRDFRTLVKNAIDRT